MQFGIEGAMANPFGRRQRFVEDSEGAIDVAGAGFGLCQRNLHECVDDWRALLAQKFDAATHVRQAAAHFPAFSLRRALEKHPPRPPQREIMLTRELGEFSGVRREAREIPAHQFEYGRVHAPICPRADMSQGCTPRHRVANEGTRAFDIAQRPQDKREVQHCCDAGVLAEAKGQIVVTTRLEQGECAFQMIPRLAIFAGDPTRYPSRAMSDAGLG